MTDSTELALGSDFIGLLDNRDLPGLCTRALFRQSFLELVKHYSSVV